MKILTPVEAFKLRHAMKQSQYSLYVTEKFLQSRYPSPNKSISASNVEIDYWGETININEDVHVIKFIGSLKSKYKGLSDLVRAIALIKDALPNLCLHILGSGDRKRYIQLASKLDVADQVIFFDPIPGGRNVIDWLQGGDIYVQLSYTEGLPRALIEAMSIGLPCIGTNVGGIPELLDQDAIVNAKNPVELAAKIKMLSDSMQLLKTLASNNYTKARNFEFSKLETIRRNYYMDLIKS